MPADCWAPHLLIESTEYSQKFTFGVFSYWLWQVLEKHFFWFLLLDNFHDQLFNSLRMYLIPLGPAHLVIPSRKLVWADYTSGRCLPRNRKWIFASCFLKTYHLYLVVLRRPRGNYLEDNIILCFMALTWNKHIFLWHQVYPRKCVLLGRQKFHTWGN